MRTTKCNVMTLMLLIFFSALAFAEDVPPSNDIIQMWWIQNSQEKIEISGTPVMIKLRNKEKAFLVPVFFSRGRNEADRTVLVRPALKEVREATDPVRRDSVAHDLNHDGISEIETCALGSGQGTTDGEKSIVQFEDWKPIVLHRKEFNDNLGCCGPPGLGCGKCESQEVKWKFIDLDHDGKDDLIEEIIIEGGASSNRRNIKKKIIRKYLFKNNMFIRLNGKQINVTILRQRLLAAGVSPSTFSIDGEPLPTESGGVLDRVSGYWRIRDYDNENFTNDIVFASENEACTYFFDRTMPSYVPWDNRNFFKQLNRLEW
jgi:hypothetical protein